MIGTKLHQQTRKAITKRKPALLAAIRKFNKYCDILKRLAGTRTDFVLPLPLSTDLGHLKNDDNLMHDVWIQPQEKDSPPWLSNISVRKGIRAVNSLDRCLEERSRLKEEAHNLLRRFGDQLVAIGIALRQAESESKSCVLSYILLTSSQIALCSMFLNDGGRRRLPYNTSGQTRSYQRGTGANVLAMLRPLLHTSPNLHRTILQLIFAIQTTV